MTYEKYVKRTLWVAQCDCGERVERTENPPRERRCKCGQWVAFLEQSYIGPELGPQRSTE